MAGYDAPNGRHLDKTEPALEEAVYLPLTGHRSCVRRVLSLPESSAVATACDDGVIRLYASSDGKLLRELHGHAEHVFGLVGLAPDVIGTCSLDGEVRTWRLSTGEQQELAFADRAGCSAMASLTDDSFVVGTKDGSLVFYRHERGRSLRDITRRRYGHTGRINAIDRADGLIVTASGDRTAAVWDLGSWQRIASLPHSSRVFSCRISAHCIATGAQDEFRIFRRTPPFAQLAVIQALHGVVWSVIPLKDGVVMSAGDETVAFTHVPTRSLIAKVRTAAIYVLGTSPLPDGRLAVCGKGRDSSNAIVTIPNEMITHVQADANFLRANSPFLSPYYERPERPTVLQKSPSRLREQDLSPRRKEILSESQRRSKVQRLSPSRLRNPKGSSPRLKDFRESPLRPGDPRMSPSWPRDSRGSPPRARGPRETPSRPRDSRESSPRPQDTRGSSPSSRSYREAMPRSRDLRESPSEMRNLSEPTRSRDAIDSPPRSRSSREPRPRQRDARELLSRENVALQAANQPASIMVERTLQQYASEPPASCKPHFPPRRTKNEHMPAEHSYVHEISADIVKSSGAASSARGFAGEALRSSPPLSQYPPDRPTESPPASRNSSTHTKDTSAGGKESSLVESLGAHSKGEPVNPHILQIRAEGPLAAEIMRAWGNRGMSERVVRELDSDQLGSMMAAFMLRYRESWSSKFDPLRNCLSKFFDEHFINGEDIVGRGAVKRDIFYKGVASALHADPSVGMKLGLANAIYRFYNTLNP